MNATIINLIKLSNKTTIQALVRDYSIERLGYMYNHIIEDAFNVKKGTSNFGAAVSDLFSEYKVNKVRLNELEPLLRTAKVKAVNSFSKDVKLKYMAEYNTLIEEYNELNKPLTKFVKEANKILKNK